MAKFEKARELAKHIDKIRAEYTNGLGSADVRIAQLATALYLIDRLALRVGNEKDTDEEADTVGSANQHASSKFNYFLFIFLLSLINLCDATFELTNATDVLHFHFSCCSLRVEHVKCLGENNQIELDFMGKDSIRYTNTITVPAAVYLNLHKFTQYRATTDPIFDKLNVRETTLSAFAFAKLIRCVFVVACVKIFSANKVEQLFGWIDAWIISQSVSNFQCIFDTAATISRQ
jgi:DNA topoisomerase-1